MFYWLGEIDASEIFIDLDFAKIMIDSFPLADEGL